MITHSEEEIQPLMGYGSLQSTEDLVDDLFQKINTDADFDQVVYGYRKSRWRSVLVYILSTLSCGIPFLVFHWCPTWLLYATSYRCSFQIAEKVLVVETYQEKCKTYFIHKIIDKKIANASGLLNEGFEDEFIDEEISVNNKNDLYTPIHLEDGTRLNVQHYRCFHHKKHQLVWESGRARWSRIVGVQRGATCADLHTLAANPPCDERRMRILSIHGLNEIKVPVQTVMKLILLEVFNPFYVFQVFTIAVWLAEPYYYYCIAVVLMSTFGVATSVIQTKKNQETLRAAVETRASVFLSSGSGTDVRGVVPGDVLLLGRGHVPCDAVLLTGEAIVNESMLTGESVPVTKSALQRVDKEFDMKEHNFSILYCGTEVIQTKEHGNEPVKVLVLRTGYSTTKGELVRSILYPAPADFKFDRDSYKFIFILAGIALLGLGYTVALKAYRSLTVGDIILKALDIITIVVPPALPAAMTVGRLYAVSRLKAAQVSCLNTRAVNVSGSLDCICFDKTGTLTEDGMDMWGVVTTNTSPPTLGLPTRDPRALNDLHELKIGMASCHSLTLLDGELVGDPLDLKMFESTGWNLEEPELHDKNNFDIYTSTIVRPKGSANIDVDDVHMPLEVCVVQKYQFVSSLQRSSVLVRLRGEDVLRAYCKGAPEMLRTLCRPDSVPVNLEEELCKYAARGFRVVALGSRVMWTDTPPKEMDRTQVECDLEFLGLVIMENRLKPATTGTIRELKEANINVVMITGDNIHTAVSVAKECGILTSEERIVTMTVVPGEGGEARVYCESTLHGVAVGHPVSLDRVFDDFDSGCGSGTSARTDTYVRDGEAPSQEPRYKIVMTGDTWKAIRAHYPLQWARVLCRGAVFARTSPDLKQQLVMDYRELGYYVGMCGDGANDVCALRAAHAGVSLSSACSVAAPFTSTRADVSCVTRLLREGRAALTTSFGVFKFMIAYSLAEFSAVAFLYYFDSNLTDFQFLYIDVALVVNFAFFFGMTEAFSGKLCELAPLTSLLGVVPLLSLVGQMALVMLGQYLSYLALTYFPWYVRHTYEGPEANECWENYAVFTISMFQYVTMVIVFSHGAPYRRSVVTNKRLMFSIIIMTAVSLYITVSPAQWLAKFLQLKMPKDSLMSYIVIALASFHFVLALFFERVIIQYVMENLRMIPHFIKERQTRKTPHLMIKRQLSDADYLSCESVMKGGEKESGLGSSTE